MRPLERLTEDTRRNDLDRRVEALERRYRMQGFYEIKLYPDPGHPVAILVPELAIVQVGDNQFDFPIPLSLNGTSLIWAEAATSIAPSSNLDVMVHNVTAAVDMLTSAIRITAGNLTSFFAGPSSVIDTDNDEVSTADTVRLDVDADGGGAAKGLAVLLHFR